MTAVLPVATARDARARAGRIREGMVNYLTLLADIKAAYDERDWDVLGYDSWESYVDAEFSEHRLKLSPEHRQKAVAELRMGGMSTRAISASLDISRNTVAKDLAQSEPPASPIRGADGKTYAPTRPAPTGDRCIDPDPGSAPQHSSLSSPQPEVSVKLHERLEIANAHRELRENLEAIPPERIAEIQESVRPAVEFARLVDACRWFLESLERVDFDAAARGANPDKALPLREAVAFLPNLRKILEAIA